MRKWWQMWFLLNENFSCAMLLTSDISAAWYYLYPPPGKTLIHQQKEQKWQEKMENEPLIFTALGSSVIHECYSYGTFPQGGTKNFRILSWSKCHHPNYPRYSKTSNKSIHGSGANSQHRITSTQEPSETRSYSYWFLLGTLYSRLLPVLSLLSHWSMACLRRTSVITVITIHPHNRHPHRPLIFSVSSKVKVVLVGI